MSFFSSKSSESVDELKKSLSVAEFTIRDLRADREAQTRYHEREVEQLEHDHNVEIRNMVSTCDGKVAAVELKLKIEKDSRANAIEEAVKKETKVLTDKCTEQAKSSAVAEAKLNLYEKAFSELGLDVKDTKEIISDLIKALGVKSQVNVISAK